MKYNYFGIQVQINSSHLLILAISILSGWYLTSSIIIAFLFMFIPSICILLHELGHSFAALIFGFRISHIELTAFGGKAVIYGAPTWQIYMAGPTTNLMLTWFFLPIFLYFRSPISLFIVIYNLVLVLILFLPIKNSDIYEAFKLWGQKLK